MSNHPIIRGAQGLLPSIHNRLEIRKLVEDRYQFSLYIQALNAMMGESFSASDFSFPSIGGIHGRPYVQWGESGPEQPPQEEQWGGYCTHGSVLFPTWHRPYVLLFEQALFHKAQQIAKSYKTEEDKWIKAADTLRSPYWDWAHPEGVEPHVPQVMLKPTITIITPKGDRTVDNPLYSYKFIDKQIMDSFQLPWKHWSTTLRYPDGQGPDAKSNMKLFDEWYNSNGYGLSSKTFFMLMLNDQWETFSNHGTQEHPQGNSLEAIHDNVHNGIGGANQNGHMSDLGVAGFDAAFWLHHTNVDRLLSLWKVLHYDKWVTPGSERDGTYTIAAGKEVNGTSDLTPFWNAQSTYWKSIQLETTEDLGYSYPEFDGIDTTSPEAIRDEIQEKVDALYPSPSVRRILTSGGSFRSWNLRIRFKKYELGASFVIQVFLDGRYVDAVSSFATTSDTRCANCIANAEKEIEGFVHLSDVLLDRYRDLPSHEPVHVRPVLGKLSFRLVGSKPDGSPADIERDLPSLKVLPYSQIIEASRSTRSGKFIPKLGQAEHFPGVMHGRLGQLPFEQWAIPA